MRILFLDDDIQRHHAIKRHFIGYEVDYVFTADDALNALRAKHYDYVFLDHDLKPEHYGMTDFDMHLPGAKPFPERADDDTGFKVVMALAAGEVHPPRGAIIIHTMSVRGWLRMMRELHRGKADVPCLRWAFRGDQNPMVELRIGRCYA